MTRENHSLKTKGTGAQSGFSTSGLRKKGTQKRQKGRVGIMETKIDKYEENKHVRSVELKPEAETERFKGQEQR